MGGYTTSHCKGMAAGGGGGESVAFIQSCVGTESFLMDYLHLDKYAIFINNLL